MDLPYIDFTCGLPHLLKLLRANTVKRNYVMTELKNR